MPKHLIFLHTSPAHIPTFDALLHELAPGVEASHIVDEGLLAEARAQGITAAVIERLAAKIDDARDQGAGAVLCTCSTIGGIAEKMSQADLPVLRVDRPMAAKAVSLGTKIVLAASLPNAIPSARDLLTDEAKRAGKTINIIEIVCRGAWAKWERGDTRGYAEVIAEKLRNVADQGDVIVLAQASMAPAAALCRGLSIPILSSPRIGLEAALAVSEA